MPERWPRMSAGPSPAPRPALRVPVWLLALLAVLLLAAPVLVPNPFVLYLATEALCWALAAAALDLLVGYLGLTPLGHIAMWGLGGYAVALLLGAGVPLAPALLGSSLIAALYSALTAPIALRAGGIFFLMVTLAFAQMTYALADRWTALTGGTDGLTFRSGLSPLELYVLTVVLTGASLLLMTRLVASPFGRVLEAIRQNEVRARALGYPVFAYKYGAVLIASGFIGLAGALAALHREIVTPGDLFWLHSATLLIMVLLGGARSLWGPVVGAALYIAVQSFVSSQTDLWAGLVGLLLIALVLTGRGGLWALIERRRA